MTKMLAFLSIKAELKEDVIFHMDMSRTGFVSLLFGFT